MYLIKPCPSCRTKLRFPIDKGTIRVRCSCGYSFIANPDDTALYDNAAFDLSTTRCALKNKNYLHRALSLRGRLIPAFINGVLNIKYQIQNFRLLPFRNKVRLAVLLSAILVLLAALIAGISILVFRSGTHDRIII